MNAARSTAGRAHIAYLAPALVLSAAIYFPAVGTFFAQDDITFLSRAAGLAHPTGLGRAISENVAFGTEYAFFGLDPVGYHLANLALHVLNAALLYVLAVKLRAGPGVAGAAAALFGVSAIAFTPLHWASGIIELLTCALLLGATLLWIKGIEGSSLWRWTAALLALVAMFSKETAVGWPLVLPFIHNQPGQWRMAGRALWPAALAAAVFLVIFILSGQTKRLDSPGAYALSVSPWHLLANLFTYIRWSVSIHEPIRDVVAAAEPNSWRIALPSLGLVAAVLWRQKRTSMLAGVGLAWWLVFLLPVLPLANHTYLYYLYIPWVGGACAVASLCSALTGSWPRANAKTIALVSLLAYVLVQERSITNRRSAVMDALPVDRTIREATLLRNALAGLDNASLPAGTEVAFVNPVPRASVDVMTGSRTRDEDRPRRVSYYPLEAAMRAGETLRLFTPRLAYIGFGDTIPRGWEDVECFYFEQRGWLKPWGRGQTALMNQAAVQMSAHQWQAAANTFGRVRALGDTLPHAVQGQVLALVSAGRSDTARAIASEFVSRWPHDPFASVARRLVSSS